MPLILNIETATTVCSVALARDGKVIAMEEVNNGYTHSENLTLFIEKIMKQSGHELTNLDAIAVSMGPGSYTGLRIGVSAAKGLCFALDKPLIAIPTLKNMALGANISLIKSNTHPQGNKDNFLFCPMIDARRMEVYCTVYNQQLDIVKPTSADIIDKNSFSNLLEAATIYFFGDGAAKCKTYLEHNKNALFLGNINPSAVSMATLSELAYLSNVFEDVAYFEPYYLKDFIAGKPAIS